MEEASHLEMTPKDNSRVASSNKLPFGAHFLQAPFLLEPQFPKKPHSSPSGNQGNTAPQSQIARVDCVKGEDQSDKPLESVEIHGAPARFLPTRVFSGTQSLFAVMMPVQDLYK